MSLALKALSGPLKDGVFPLKDGLTLGRQGATIVLEDKKISSVHARVVLDGKNWMIEDNNSKNGIRIDGERVANIRLVPEIRFQVGDSHFLVIEVAEERPDLVAESAPDSTPYPTEPEPPKPKPAKKQRYWHEILSEFAGKAAAQFEDQPKAVSTLEPAVVLEFVRGTQVNSKWVLGFGPRKIGAASVDLPIWEPGAPSTCFEIFPGVDGVMFKTNHPELVTLNGESVDSRVLRVGDTIAILDTLIEVDFIE